MGVMRGFRRGALPIAWLLAACPVASAAPEVDLSLPASAEAGDATPIAVLVHGTAAGVSLVANVGTVGALAPSGEPGVRRAEWIPPKGRVPRVVVIAATDGNGAVLDWGAFPLVGQAKVTTRSKPGADVTLAIGGREHGPVRAGRNGIAEFTVPIRPGETSAVSRARDLAGRTEETVLALEPPPFLPLLLLCPGQGAEVRVLVASTGGAPREAAPIAFESDAGALGAPIATAPGAYDLVLDPAASTAEFANVRVGLEDSKAPPATCRKHLPGELPTGIDLDVERSSIVAGGEPARVSVTLRYPGRRPAEPVAVSFTADHGTIDAPSRAADGTWRATWRIPPELGGRSRARITARATGATPLEADGSIALGPGAVQRIELRADRTRIRADGRSSLGIRVEAYDAFGNPAIDGSGVTIESAEGELGPLAWTTSGGAVATWRAPKRNGGGEATIAARAAATGAEGSLRVRMLPGRGRFSAAAGAGWTTNLGRVSAPTAVVTASWRVPRLLDERVSVGAEAGWFRSRATPRDANGDSLSIDVEAAPILLRATADVLRGPVDLYAGASAGALIARVSSTSASTGDREGGGWRPAAGVLAGAELPVLGRARAVVEVGWRHAPVSGAGIRGNAAGLSGSALWRVDF